MDRRTREQAEKRTREGSMMRSVSAEMEKRSVSMLRSGGRERAEKDEAHHIVLRVQFDMRMSAAMARLSNVEGNESDACSWHAE